MFCDLVISVKFWSSLTTGSQYILNAGILGYIFGILITFLIKMLGWGEGTVVIFFFWPIGACPKIL